ncbi:MAG: STAS domain-containing protein [Bacteroidales bacterium]|jgi:anti-sigma B factor antagonist|nr:STAS domain-containing protein [Bacteroidales bacterium]
MKVTINKEEKATVVVLTGRLDTPSAQEVSKAMEPVVADASGTIILDCSGLEYISSSGLRIFLTVRKAAAVQGGKVIVKGINSDIRNVFMMTGFLNLFEIEA